MFKNAFGPSFSEEPDESLSLSGAWVCMCRGLTDFGFGGSFNGSRPCNLRRLFNSLTVFLAVSVRCLISYCLASAFESSSKSSSETADQPGILGYCVPGSALTAEKAFCLAANQY